MLRLTIGRDLRRSIEEPEDHEEDVGLAEARGDNAEGVHEADDNEDLSSAQRVSHGAPDVRSRHHA